jgi:hypothetical protein
MTYVKAALIVALFIASNTVSAGEIVNALTKVELIVMQIKMLLISVSSLAGLWAVFSGINELVNSKGQSTPGQSFGKIIAGVILVSLLAWMAAITNELGIEKTSNTAISSGFGG